MRRSLLTCITVLALLSAACRAGPDSDTEAVRLMSARISEEVERYLSAALCEKTTHLEVLDAVLDEFERTDTGGTWKSTVQHERLTCLMRRVKVAVLANDKKAARKAASAFQKAFEATGRKLGPKWFEKGELSLRMLVEFADAEDQMASDAMENRRTNPNRALPSAQL